MFICHLGTFWAEGIRDTKIPSPVEKSLKCSMHALYIVFHTPHFPCHAFEGALLLTPLTLAKFALDIPRSYFIPVCLYIGAPRSRDNVEHSCAIISRHFAGHIMFFKDKAICYFYNILFFFGVNHQFFSLMAEWALTRISLGLLSQSPYTHRDDQNVKF